MRSSQKVPQQASVPRWLQLLQTNHKAADHEMVIEENEGTNPDLKGSQPKPVRPLPSEHDLQFLLSTTQETVRTSTSKPLTADLLLGESDASRVHHKAPVLQPIKSDTRPIEHSFAELTLEPAAISSDQRFSTADVSDLTQYIDIEAEAAQDNVIDGRILAALSDVKDIGESPLPSDQVVTISKWLYKRCTINDTKRRLDRVRDIVRLKSQAGNSPTVASLPAKDRGSIFHLLSEVALSSSVPLPCEHGLGLFWSYVTFIREVVDMTAQLLAYDDEPVFKLSECTLPFGRPDSVVRRGDSPPIILEFATDEEAFSMQEGFTIPQPRPYDALPLEKRRQLERYAAGQPLAVIFVDVFRWSVHVVSLSRDIMSAAHSRKIDIKDRLNSMFSALRTSYMAVHELTCTPVQGSPSVLMAQGAQTQDLRLREAYTSVPRKYTTYAPNQYRDNYTGVPVAASQGLPWSGTASNRECLPVCGLRGSTKSEFGWQTIVAADFEQITARLRELEELRCIFKAATRAYVARIQVSLADGSFTVATSALLRGDILAVSLAILGAKRQHTFDSTPQPDLQALCKVSTFAQMTADDFKIPAFQSSRLGWLAGLSRHTQQSRTAF